MKCNFCNKKTDELKSMEAFISVDLKSDKKESMIVNLCNHCINKIKGEPND